MCAVFAQSCALLKMVHADVLDVLSASPLSVCAPDFPLCRPPASRSPALPRSPYQLSLSVSVWVTSLYPDVVRVVGS